MQRPHPTLPRSPGVDRPPTTAREALRVGRLLVLSVGITLLSGCGKVAAYERGKLAHPTMEADAAASTGQDHVYAIHEGAMGGSVGIASGCGCN
jgi:hypothetical protein